METQTYPRIAECGAIGDAPRAKRIVLSSAPSKLMPSVTVEYYRAQSRVCDCRRCNALGRCLLWRSIRNRQRDAWPALPDGRGGTRALRKAHWRLTPLFFAGRFRRSFEALDPKPRGIENARTHNPFRLYRLPGLCRQWRRAGRSPNATRRDRSATKANSPVV